MRRLPVLAIVVAAALAACGGGSGDDGDPASPAPPSSAEQKSKAVALARVFGRANPASFGLGPGLNVRSTMPCPNGGSTTYSGRYDVDLDPPRIRMAVSQSFDNCRAPGDDGTIWTFDTDRPTTMTIDWRSSPGVETVAITMFGDVDVTDSSGRPVPQCAVDLDIDATFFDDGRATLRMRGTLCGAPADVDLPLP